MIDRRTRRKKKARNRQLMAVALAVLVAAAVGLIVAVLPAGSVLCTPFRLETPGTKSFKSLPCTIVKRTTFYRATVKTSLGVIKFGMNPGVAPLSVNNFVFLARAHFYDGMIFHRIENAPDHALVQTGDPTGTGKGGPGYTFRDKATPYTKYLRGIVAMASNGHQENGSQFFFVVRDYAKLAEPYQYPTETFFGIVTDTASLQVLDKIASVPVSGTRPVTNVVVESVTIEG